MKTIFDDARQKLSDLERSALTQVIDWCGGADELAKRYDVTEGTVRRSLKHGKLGRYLAYQIAQDKDAPFELHELRADYESILKIAPLKRPGPKVKIN